MTRLKTLLLYLCAGIVTSLYAAWILSLPREALQKHLFLLIALPAPALALLGYLIHQKLIARNRRLIRKITEIADTISHENLDLRVKEERGDEELRRLTVAFNDMVSRLGESFEYIRDSSSYIAHELKTPIAIIKGESEFALKKERKTDEYRRVIGISLDETRRMLKIIEDLLLLTKMNYQPEVLNFEEIDLTQFIRIIYEQTKILSAEKKLSVNLDIPEESGIIEGDELHLRRLFLNLIDNAIKFTPPNGSIGISLKYGDGQALVSISDTGKGIARENLPKLFEKFFRIDEKTQQGSSGSGLGLSIAQSIVHLHKGEITVTSQIGRGSRFTVSLPLKSSHQPLPEA